MSDQSYNLDLDLDYALFYLFYLFYFFNDCVNLISRNTTGKNIDWYMKTTYFLII